MICLNLNLAYKNLIAITIVAVLFISIVSIQEALAVGLKVFVNLSHGKTGSANVCVSSTGQNLGCKTVTLSGLATPYTVGPFTFGENVIASGGQFKACTTNLANNQYKCVTGTNSPAKVPEYVSITVPSGSASVGEINWLDLCRIPVVDGLLSEPCETLTTPDGYILTSEGKRVVGCIVGIIGGSAALLLADPTGKALATAEELKLGNAIGCRG